VRQLQLERKFTQLLIHHRSGTIHNYLSLLFSADISYSALSGIAGPLENLYRWLSADR